MNTLSEMLFDFPHVLQHAERRNARPAKTLVRLVSIYYGEQKYIRVLIYTFNDSVLLIQLARFLFLL